MQALLLLAALPTLAGVVGAGGDVVLASVGAGGGEGRGAGVVPRFVTQHTRVAARLGRGATLHCAVQAPPDQDRELSVSWVRARDLQILAHAGDVFTGDARVSASVKHVALHAAPHAAPHVTSHSLRIERLRASDAGRYECQLNTEPKMSLFFNLTVVDEPVPALEVGAVGADVVQGSRGGAATLACEARLSPEPRRLPPAPLLVIWRRRSLPLDLHSGRGGVSLDTERWAGRVVSRLTLAELDERDAGPYECVATAEEQEGEDRPPDAVTTLLLRIIAAHESDSAAAEAMQRDEAGGGAAESGAEWAGCACRLLALGALLALRL